MQNNVMRTLFILLMLLGVAAAVTAQDSLTVGDSITAEATGEDVTYTLELEADETVEIDLSSEDFDTLVIVQNANGEELARNDDGGEGFNSLLEFEAPEAGEYTVVVTSFFNNTNGEYTLSVSSASGSSTDDTDDTDDSSDEECGTATSSGEGDIQVGETVNGDANGEETYDISLNEGQTVVITLSSEDFDSYLELLDDRERIIDEDDDSAGSLNSRIVFTADATELYTIVVRSFGGDADGAYTLSVRENCASSEGGTIEYGQTLELVPDGAFEQLINFEGTEGDVINLYAVSSTGEDTMLSLLDPDGDEITRDDDSGEGTNPAIRRFVLPESGTYTAILAGFSGREMFDPIEVTLESTELLEVGSEPVEVTLGEDASSEVLVFDAVDDERYLISFEFEEDIESSMYINVLQEDESYAATNFSISGVTSFAAIITADETGQAQLQIEYYGYGGDTTFTVAVEPLD